MDLELFLATKDIKELAESFVVLERRLLELDFMLKKENQHLNVSCEIDSPAHGPLKG